MKQLTTKGIVLKRTNYREADRIITVLTSNQGKIHLLAKGVRKIKSKMAGGIELFSINDITYIVGKGDLGTLISSRLDKNYGSIVKDLDKTMYMYEALKLFDKITEDTAENEYFILLHKVLSGFNDPRINIITNKVWLNMQLLKITGHSPNILTDRLGKRLEASEKYNISTDDMVFVGQPTGLYTADHIKLLRIAIDSTYPHQLARIQCTEELLQEVVQLSQVMVQQHTSDT